MPRLYCEVIVTEETRGIIVECVKTLALPAIGAWGAHWWHTRTRNNLPGLQVFPSKWAAKVVPDAPSKPAVDPSGQPAALEAAAVPEKDKAPAILFEFKNTTREVVFIHRCRLMEVTARCHPGEMAFFDIGERSYELKFQPPGRRDYILKEVVLQTGETARTTIPLAKPWDGEIPKQHRRSWLPPFRRRPNYFCIRYEVAAGEKSYSIRTVF